MNLIEIVLHFTDLIELLLITNKKKNVMLTISD